MDRLLLRVTEAAVICGIGRSKAYELVAMGEWPSVRIGRSVRVPLEALKRWAARITTEAEADREDKVR